jgi:hypothetical protein
LIIHKLNFIFCHISVLLDNNTFSTTQTSVVQAKRGSKKKKGNKNKQQQNLMGKKEKRDDSPSPPMNRDELEDDDNDEKPAEAKQLLQELVPNGHGQMETMKEQRAANEEIERIQEDAIEKDYGETADVSQRMGLENFFISNNICFSDRNCLKEQKKEIKKEKEEIATTGGNDRHNSRKRECGRRGNGTSYSRNRRETGQYSNKN